MGVRLGPINLITTNRNKVAEIVNILQDSVVVRTQAVDLPEIQGSTEEIAMDKCRKAAIAVNGPVLIEDSSLELHALNGLPGPYIKWFFSAIGNDGLVKLLADFQDKSATAVCTLAYASGPDQEPRLFQGRNVGQIVAPRGSGGFAYDPVFEYEGETYAEMSAVKKNKVSDRAKGLLKLKSWLIEQGV